VADPSIQVGPEHPLLDTPLEVRLAGLPPRGAVTVAASMHDQLGRRWAARASFRADDSGAVEVARQPPVAGGYDCADPMGLIWSMTPEQGTGASVPAGGRLAPQAVTFTVEVDGRQVAAATVERLRLAPGIRRQVVREHGLVGTLFTREDGEPRPGVVVLGGAEGGLHEPDAALLAAHGFTALALAYFGVDGVPAGLVEVPLEYFEAAIDLLRGQERVQGERLAVIGGSRGGEAALLVGATFPNVRAVVSTVGGGLMTQGIPPGGDLLGILSEQVPSWTLRGRPLPFLPCSVTPELRRQVHAGEPVDLSLAFLPGLDDPSAVAGAIIPVERIQGAVLLLSCGDDRGWPSVALSRLACDRLTGARHPHPDRHVSYPTAGHPIAPPPYGPTTELAAPGPGVRFAMGGTAAANAAAREDAWRQALRFLREHL
jgi:dienelactone hydrolase